MFQWRSSLRRVSWQLGHRTSHVTRPPGNARQRPTIRLASEEPGPSLRASLTLLAATIAAVSFYGTYKVAYCHESVFLPLWISAKKRNPYKSELDRDEFLQHIKERLHDRLAVDEEVNQLLGVALEFPGHPDDQFEVYIRTSTPGITGLMVEPSGKWSFTSRPFASPAGGVDRLLHPFLPGETDSDDTREEGDQPSFYEAVVDGTMHVRASSGYPGQNHTIKDAIVQFRATRSLCHVNATPRFSNTVLIYDDKSGEKVYQRLW
jgi:hypothetical protein